MPNSRYLQFAKIYITFAKQFLYPELSMGTNTSSSLASSSTLSLSSLLKRYQVIQKNTEKSYTIVKEKDSQNLFIIKELSFVDKMFYERNLCRFSHFQQREQSENVLNLNKVWTEEHSTFCSNTYKIFPIYEYSNVTLKDQMDARRGQSKHFEEEELLGMIQSCVNAFNSQPPILISPSEYYICQEGLLKVNNSDLFDSTVLETYTNGVYYSFEKMEIFDQTSWYANDENYLRQTIFSLGVTLISCIYLQDISENVYNPLNHNKKMRLNEVLLDQLIGTINSRGVKDLSNKLIDLIKSMVHRDPKKRLTLSKIQNQLDQIVKLRRPHVQIDPISQKGECEPEQKMSGIQLDQSMVHKEGKQNIYEDFPLFNEINGQNLSTIQDRKVMNNFVSAKSKELSDCSDMEILREISNNNSSTNKINCHQIRQKFQVPLIASIPISTTDHPQTFQPLTYTYISSQQGFYQQKPLPSPISQQNPLFTNPQFLAKINQEIKHFSMSKRKHSFASTQISRKNSEQFFGLRENHFIVDSSSNS